MLVDLSRARRCPVWRHGVGPDDLHECFPNVLVRGNTQECWLLVCILVVSKAHVCASLSSHPLCVSALPSARGPPLQSSRFLPSPSQPTTQQVERWSPRALLWPGSPRPGLRMMDSAQAPSARGQDPQAELGWGVGLASRALFCCSGAPPISPPSFPASSCFCIAAGCALMWVLGLPAPLPPPSSRVGSMRPAHLFRPGL